MSDFERLKEYDIEEIYHKTYIARKYIKALLEKDFSKFDRLKALGFVKIIEREFNLDLSDLKKDIDEYFAKKSISSKPDVIEKSEEIKHINEEKKEKGNSKFFISLLIAAVLIGIGLYVTNFLENKGVKKEEIKSIGNETVDEKIFFEKNVTNIVKEEKKTFEEENLSLKKEDKNITTKLVEGNISKSVEPKAVFPKITIFPKQKVWVGIVYLDDYTRKNYVTDSPIELNTTRDQLIVTGHGNIDLEVDGNLTEYKETNKLRFLYRAGEIEKIDKKTFIKYNRGKNW